MSKLRHLLLLLTLLLHVSPSVHADTWRASLLTCAPGDEIYELYGHTALRLRNDSTGEDWVFNYGMFSFKKPHFVWRFVLGQTDYELGVAPFDLFADSYARDGRNVEEQMLNLREDEANRLCAELLENYRPENRTYRYNFLYDNCTTRAIDRIAACIDGKIVFPEKAGGKTFRDIIHEFSAGSPWDRLGQDLLIGSEVDRPISTRQQMFSPIYAKRYVAEAYVERTDGSREPLAQPAATIVSVPEKTASRALPAPAAAVSVLALLSAVLIFSEWKRRMPMQGFDIGWMLAQGSLGCVIALLFFFSEHPAVGSNWLILLFNPLYWAAIPLYLSLRRRQRMRRFYAAQCAVLAVFAIAGIAGIQRFPAEIWALALILLSQSISGYWLSASKEKAALAHRQRKG